MSALIMLRLDELVFIATDGGNYRGLDDFTLTGVTAKTYPMPHISAAIVGIGNVQLKNTLIFNHDHEWCTFDRMVETMRDNVTMEMNRCREWNGPRDLFGIIAFAGWSESKERMESYYIVAQGERANDPVPAAAMFCTPEPSDEALSKNGLVKGEVNLTENYEEFFRQTMQAQRETNQFMGREGFEPTGEGSIVGGFIQLTKLTKDLIATKIIHRWPDLIGEQIDVSRDKK